MLNPSLRCILGLAVALACIPPAAAQQRTDPLTRFLDGFFKGNGASGSSAGGEAVPPSQPAPAPAVQPQAPAAEPAPPRSRTVPPAAVQAKPDMKQKAASPKPRPAPARQASQPQPRPPASSAVQAQPGPQAGPAESQATAMPAASVPSPDEPRALTAAPAAEPPKPARSTPAQAAPASTPVAATAPPSTPASTPVPTPETALERVNAYFNSIDQMSAYFVQTSSNGPRAEGTLSLRRPGQVHFAYAPPSTLEIVSDGRNVAIRDKRLGTNDVYPIGQTPLKFLLQENVDLARDTKVRDVQVARDGVVTVRFDDSATLGGTSKITLRYDSRANALKQWTIIDSQGYETTVTLSGLNVVRRRDVRAAN